ncbi:MAG: Ig domain-containing protein [Clostridia bacterium]|nr:Ig domain-containing protein [Clostridia bacterium]
MKALKRIIAVIMTVLMIFGTVSMGITSVAASKKVKKIKLNKTSLTIYVGETYSLKASVSPSNASNKKVTWSSSDKKVATVSSSGKITAKKAGKVTITVKAKDGSGKKATCKVTVKKLTKVSKIKLNKTSVKLKVGSTSTVKATVSPSSATNKSVSWSSSNKKVATVSSKGKITAVGAGTAKITVKAKDGSGKKATVKVTVSPVKVSKVALNKTSATMATNGTLTLSATVSPSNATNKAVTWKSSDTKVATVSSSGVVTTLKKGTATITATAKDGSGKKASCKITVNSIGASAISLNKTSYTGAPGTSLALTATLSPSNVSKKTLTWKSSNSSVASVDSSGNVKLLKDGTATITATTTDGTNRKATCKITVKTVSVTSVRLSASKINLTQGTSGNTYKLTATVSPSNASNKAVTWTSSNSSVATVDSNGTVRAIKAGTATITVTTKDGSKKASCTVIVTPKVTEITVLPSSFSWYVGKTGTMTATVQPKGANTAVTWSSSDKNYVTVDSNGNVKVIKEQKVLGMHRDKDVTITATAKDGSGVKGKYTITIKEKVDVTGIEFAKDEKGNNLNSNKFFVNQVFTPTITYSPSNASEKTCTYTSSNLAVAKPQDDGTILMVGEGSATITAISVDGGKKATFDITVETPSLYFREDSVNVETVTSQKTVSLILFPQPISIVSQLGLNIEIADESVLKFVSYRKVGTLYLVTLSVVGSGETTVTASAGNIVKTEIPAKVTVVDVAVNTLYEGLSAGETVTVDPKVMVGDKEIETVQCFDYDISTYPVDYTQYFENGWVVNADGSVTFKIKKDLPQNAVDCVYVDMTYIHGGSSSKRIEKKLYFSPDEFEVPPANFEQVKAYSEFATNAQSAVRDKDAHYLDTKVSDSDIGLKASNPLINGFISINKDTLLEEMGMESGDIIYELFSESVFETKNDTMPKLIACDESMVEKVTVNENPGSTTFDIVLELKDQAKMGVGSVATSQYAKAMPVLDKAYVDNFANEMKTAMGSGDGNSVSYGTLNQTYRDGRVVITVSKITNQVEKVECYFKSDLDFANAKMVMSEDMDDFGTLDVTVTASFTMTVEETLTYYNFKY